VVSLDVDTPQIRALLAGHLVMQNPLEWPALRAEVAALVEEVEARRLAAPPLPREDELAPGYPNLWAIISGTVSGNVSEWPAVRGELIRLIEDYFTAREFAVRLLITHEHRDAIMARAIVDSAIRRS